jgi:hypothetical protein
MEPGLVNWIGWYGACCQVAHACVEEGVVGCDVGNAFCVEKFDWCHFGNAVNIDFEMSE